MKPILTALLLLPLAGCLHNDILADDPVAAHPDHRIIVAPAAPGSATLKAYAPECPSWADHRPAPLDNMPQPQIGCASQRNLALMIDRPADLVAPRKLGPTDAARAASAMERMHTDKVRGLNDPANPPTPKE